MLSLDQLWKLAKVSLSRKKLARAVVSVAYNRARQAWYQNKANSDYRRKSLEEVKKLFDSLDMTDEFWQL